MALRAALMPCTDAAKDCAVLASWDNTSSTPCPVKDCSRCKFSDGSCEVPDANGATTCVWRHIECKNYRVSKIQYGASL